MTDLDDMALLREYAAEKSEAAFATLVGRNINLVYSAALRQTGGDTHRAEEITQVVFIILSRKASSLRSGTILPGWLLRTVRFTAATELRTEVRRQRHEQEANMEAMIQQEPAPAESDWEQIAPLLDEALAALGEKDRNAVALRFFKEMTIKEVGSALGINEDAAQKRIARAVEKIRRFFVKRGVVTPAVAIIPALTGRAVQAAPSGLVASVTAGVALKGAGGASSAAALTQATMKLIAWAQMKTVVIIGVAMLFAMGAATMTRLATREEPDPVAAQVMEIIVTNALLSVRNISSDTQHRLEARAQILALGPKALPALSKLIVWRDTDPADLFEQLWPAMSDDAKRAFADPVEDHFARSVVTQMVPDIISQIGPAAARPLARKVEQALPDSYGHQSDLLLDALYWSLPDSAAAVSALTNWLQDPSRGHLFSSTTEDDIWPQIPQVAPLLIPWLGNRDSVAEAAGALGAIGSHAAAAVPSLIEVCDYGTIQAVVRARNPMEYAPNIDLMSGARCSALTALGNIGVKSPEVLAVLDRCLADTNQAVRLAALGAFGNLGMPPTKPLEEVLAAFALSRTRELIDAIHCVGNMGTNGQAALPWLQKLTSLEYDATLPAPGRPTVVISPASLSSEAIVAICRIDPLATREHLPDLIARTQAARWYAGQATSTSAQILMAGEPFAPEIVARLEPLLRDTNVTRHAFEAYMVLSLNPDHAEALGVLSNAVTHGELGQRLLAAHWLWKATGKTGALVPLCREALLTTNSVADPELPAVVRAGVGNQTGQHAAEFLGELGDQARPAIPELKAALWNPDYFVRQYSGKTLRKVAPEELPTVR